MLWISSNLFKWCIHEISCENCLLLNCDSKRYFRDIETSALKSHEQYWQHWGDRGLLWRFNSLLRPRKNGRHFPDDVFKLFLLHENAWISLIMSLKFAPKVPINNIPALIQIMAWRRRGDKPLSELMMVNLMTHIYLTTNKVGMNYWLYVIIFKCYLRV